MRTARALLFVWSTASVVGCAVLIGEPDPFGYAGSADASDESTVADASTETSTSDAEAGADAADASSPYTYSDITQSNRWTSFNLSTVDGGGQPLNQFQSGGFDGRYVYFFQDNGGPPSIVLRFDTTGSFTAASSYATFDLSSLDARGPSVRGAVFQSPYLYLVPGATRNDAGFIVSPFIRYDPRNDPSFSNLDAWRTFDLHNVEPNLGIQYWGGTSDGTNVYLTSWYFAPASAIKYRTTEDFTSVGAYEAVSVGALDQTLNAPSRPGADAAGGHLMAGAVFDGKYVTYPPAQNADYFVRYDTAGTFGNPTQAWSAFDITTVLDAAGGSPSFFLGGAFDGRYSYYHFNRGDVFVRFDNQGAFSDPASWKTAQPTLPSPNGFVKMGVFDGRYVYPIRFDGLALRYDTTKDFTANASYETFDLKTLDPSANDFRCAVFDGKYVYYAPGAGSLLVRFEAKSPAGLPPTYHGSQF